MFDQGKNIDDNYDCFPQSNSSQGDNSPRRRPKQNTKNTYIKKISSLMKMPTEMQPDVNSGNSQEKKTRKGQSNAGGEHPYRDNDKLAKNRESARNSRKRKKIYLELLENKVTILSEQLESYKTVFDRNQQLSFKLQNKINQRREQDQQKFVLFNNMNNSVQSNTSDNNIDAIIDSLNKKFGSGSIERSLQLDHYCQQILDNSISPQANFLITRARTNADMFSTIQADEDQANLIRRLKLTDKQKQTLNKKKAKLAKSYNEIASSLQSITDLKNQIQSELTGLDQTLELLRRELKPQQVARFLLAIEKKDSTGQYKESFERCFGSGDLMEEDDSLDLQSFITENNICNSLGIDIQEAYEVYKSSNDFLLGKTEQEAKLKSERMEA